MTQITFVSDLHLFAKRSTAETYFDSLIESAQTAEELILGGDIFDFRWSIYPTADATADAAVAWLDKLISSSGYCKVRFIFGNHDDHPLLHARLPDLQKRHPNFEWNRFLYRRGDTVFLHGDVADKTMTGAALKEQRNNFEHGSRSPIQHSVYDLAIKAQLHRIAPPAVYPKKKVAKRILNYLELMNHTYESGLRHVCFGHTHRPVDHYSLKGVTFHNCGAPIGSGKFRIVNRLVETNSATEPS